MIPEGNPFSLDICDHLWWSHAHAPCLSCSACRLRRWEVTSRHLALRALLCADALRVGRQIHYSALLRYNKASTWQKRFSSMKTSQRQAPVKGVKSILVAFLLLRPELIVMGRSGQALRAPGSRAAWLPPTPHLFFLLFRAIRNACPLLSQGGHSAASSTKVS